MDLPQSLSVCFSKARSAFWGKCISLLLQSFALQCYRFFKVKYRNLTGLWMVRDVLQKHRNVYYFHLMRGFLCTFWQFCNFDAIFFNKICNWRAFIRVCSTPSTVQQDTRSLIYFRTIMRQLNGIDWRQITFRYFLCVFNSKPLSRWQMQNTILRSAFFQSAIIHGVRASSI